MAKTPQAVGTSKTAPTSVQFGDVKVGDTRGRAIVITNKSSVPAHWSFCVEDKGVFQFSEVCGVWTNTSCCTTTSGGLLCSDKAPTKHPPPAKGDLVVVDFGSDLASRY